MFVFLKVGKSFSKSRCWDLYLKVASFNPKLRGERLISHDLMTSHICTLIVKMVEGSIQPGRSNDTALLPCTEGGRLDNDTEHHYHLYAYLVSSPSLQWSLTRIWYILSLAGSVFLLPSCGTCYKVPDSFTTMGIMVAAQC